MNFALLGDDPVARRLSEAAISAGHRLTRTWWTRLASDSNRPDPWELMLTDSSIEAVIVGGDGEELQTAAKQLASSGKPLLIVPNLGFADACAYELSLIRDDSHVVLMPAFEQRLDPELQSLSRRLLAGELGSVRRLQIDVELADRQEGTRTRDASTTGVLLSEEEIFSAMLVDVDLLRWLGGNYDQVTSSRSGQSDQGSSLATLILAGSGLADATWTVRRGARASWMLTVESDAGPFTIKRSQTEARDTELIAAFVSACQLKTIPQPDWSDAVRVCDVLDAAKRSLRRRRTIDLHFETLSERQQFKTQMTAIGCGLLMLTLVLMLGLLGLGSLLDSRDRAVRDAAESGLLFQATDFTLQSAELIPDAAKRLDAVAARLKEEPKSVYIEPADAPPDPELDRRRRAEIAKLLNEQGVAAADHRTLVATPKSPFWEMLMKVLRLAWMAPLVVFLVLQILLLVAKPTTGSTREER